MKVKLPKGTKVIKVAAAEWESFALTSTGKALAWGYNAEGELGDGTTSGPGICTKGPAPDPCSTKPVRVKLPEDTKVIKVAAGDGHSLALTSTGSLLAWGGNFAGQLGDSTTKGSDLPVEVKLPKGDKVTAVAAGPGADHSLAIVHHT